MTTRGSMKNLLIILSFLFLSNVAFSTEGTGGDEKKKKPDTTQAKQQRKAKPDVPGDLIIDLGFNILQGEPEDMALGWWGSKTVNINYAYNLPLGKSNFVFSPGIGLGLDKYSFDNDVTLASDGDGTSVVQLSDILSDDASLNKTKLATTYLEVPLELRFYANKSDVSRSFKTALGVKGGLLLSSHTKIKYKEDGGIKKQKNKDQLNINRFRYSSYARIGVGGFSVFFNYNLSELFKSDKGPDMSEINVMTAGISINGF